LTPSGGSPLPLPTLTMPNTLVIVESPAKARTIEKYLGKGYTVESSIGHIRDLPKSAAEIPEKYRNEAWARLGLNVEEDFRPLYVVSAEKRQHVAKLRKLTAEADELILATDDDREGESIAWHLLQELKPKVPVKRMVFHEITREAIQAAIANPRSIDTNLVEAQERAAPWTACTVTRSARCCGARSRRNSRRAITDCP